MYSHSSTSSPDILGTPGDADYLISSPIKPFPGRQSIMSPANFKLLHTPQTGKGKKSRASFTPGRSAHSIRFDDVLLPVSPAMKLDGGQRALSPDKTQADGNASPWRIRVTLEATQDEEPNQESPARKRLRPSMTTTTKIPLKGEEGATEETPRRRRGRPRKSDILAHDATPIPGSPGHTPGPAGTSGQKRKRGRPRKNPAPVPDAVEKQPDTQGMDEAPPTIEAPPVIEPEKSWSPLNLAADADSDDGLPDIQDFGDPFETENRSSPRVRFEQTFDTPHVNSPDDPYTQNPNGNWDSTPSKMPSPSRESQIVSPDNTLHAGHTPMPPRTYPTPTSSSLVDDEKQGPEPSANPTSNGDFLQSEAPPSHFPTDEPKEFDSIMESEGFSMVSLDTLPSAKQHALNADGNAKQAKSALKRVLDQDTIGTLKRRNRDHNTSDAPKAQPKVSLTQPQTTDDIPQSDPVLERLSSSETPRLVRVGIALEGTMRHAYESEDTLSSPLIPNSGDQISDMAASRKRLELLFDDLNPEVQQELRLGLAFGHELAKRRRQAEIETAKQLRAAEPNVTDTPPRINEGQNKSKTPLQRLNGRGALRSPSTMMKRRMEEWQKEREAISKEIQMANSSQVIVIGSDDGEQENPVSNAYSHESSLEHERQPELDRGSHLEAEVEPGDELSDDVDIDQEDQYQNHYPYDDGFEEQDDDDAYEDIWQQEAHNRDDASDHSPYENQGNGSLEQESSPWMNGSSKAQSEDGSFSPDYRISQRDKMPSMGWSRVRQLREQEVDISALLRAEYTPKRSRYYYGKSSPMSSAKSKPPNGSPSSIPSEEEGDARDNVPGHDLQSDVYLESSPRRESDDETFLIDPTTRHENSWQLAHPQLDANGDQSIPDAAVAEPLAARGTPERPQPANADIQGSSWFQKITSLTPGWLKAPGRRLGKRPSPPVSEAVSGYNEQVGEVEAEANERDGEENEESSVEPAQLDNNDGAETTEEQGVDDQDLEETPKPLPQFAREDGRLGSSASRPGQMLDETHATPNMETNGETYERQFPLALSGYFSDDHYLFLRHLYRLAKRHPERFPYYPSTGRPGIIGDWIWTSDGAHGVPITERQFAIVDRFVQELAKADIQAGGTGQVGWTEADLHRRLISIIIGEEVRKKRKVQVYEGQQREEPL
ncbi:hypothetical protein EYZ11_000276 [Aspergillus tanneri]|uniref:AT DNA binding protein n=1 Tax=Aspergillus tanneri TaxID=1220188 RepID=A0A4S3JXJ7_9EURO|nr:hypothetical protein EYZ11_000276 [Aspergillus tanneri]